MATMSPGVRPTISRASEPMARGFRVRLLMATQLGSLIMMPLSRTQTRVLAVPRSMPMSREKRPRAQSNGLNKLEILDRRLFLFDLECLEFMKWLDLNL